MEGNPPTLLPIEKMAIFFKQKLQNSKYIVQNLTCFYRDYHITGGQTWRSLNTAPSTTISPCLFSAHAYRSIIS